MKTSKKSIKQKLNDKIYIGLKKERYQLVNYYLDITMIIYLMIMIMSLIYYHHQITPKLLKFGTKFVK